MRRTTSGALSLLVCAALLGGCGEDEQDPDAEPGSSSSSPSADDPDPSESTESAVEPASGEVVRLGSLTVTFPQGFDTREASSMGGDVVTGDAPDGDARIAFVAAEDYNRQSLDTAVEYAIAAGLWLRKPERLEDVKVDGVRMYHLSGPGTGGFTDVQFGAEHGGYDISLTIGAPGPAAERQALIDSILATATWN